MSAEEASGVPEGLLEVGRVGRAHGVRGDLFVDLTTDRSERAAVGSRLWVRGRWMTISASSRSNERWRVHFDGVDTREVAQALTGGLLYAPPIDDADALWVHQVIGAHVIEVNGIERGRCTAVIENPASDLLELDTGSLVPAVFVTAVDVGEHGTLVTIDPPDGLFDLGE
ncbi:MAG: ribosome maturation factor RimM [Ilumatobacter sp.]|uniref:ribosome maturation factor RimM n=1 Tax=Ilumatobacter sp. TaxID=1967498 RepID=UPI00260399EF|nr:ribosome maturation factor RimM [Ilumatobacter sp.]MDJ0768260.1 ribosome maturation factor RimM [Ilumatobacter sp.]